MNWFSLLAGVLLFLTPAVEATVMSALPAGLAQTTLFPAGVATLFAFFSPGVAVAVTLVAATWRDLALVAPAGATLAGAIPMALTFIVLPRFLTNRSYINSGVTGAAAAGVFLLGIAVAMAAADRLGFPVAAARPGLLPTVATILLSAITTAAWPMASRQRRTAAPS